MRFITLRSFQNMHLTDHSLGLEHLICPVVILAHKATGKPEKKLLISAGYHYKETEMIWRQRENGFGGEVISSTVIVNVWSYSKGGVQIIKMEI